MLCGITMTCADLECGEKSLNIDLSIPETRSVDSITVRNLTLQDPVIGSQSAECP